VERRTVIPMPDRPSYADVMASVATLMNAHLAELRGGRTQELRAVTSRAHAELAQLVYAATDRPERPPEPADDPKLPLRRDPRKL
jgi:hypothetical protein